jgi:hypothetical protein
MEKLREIEKTTKELNDLINLVKTNELSAENRRTLILIAYTAKRLDKEVSEGVVYDLEYCDNCMQMTNHLDGVCQKCK